MFCDACGNKVDDGQKFCPSCGRPLQPIATTAGYSAAPGAYAAPAPPRVASNIKLLGILWLIYSAVHFIPGLIIIGVFAGAASFLPPDVPGFVHILIASFGVLLCGVSGIGLLAGWGLMSWKPWARMLSIVLGIINLISFPFGTALGIFTLWVLFPAESEREYQQNALAAGNV